MHAHTDKHCEGKQVWWRLFFSQAICQAARWIIHFVLFCSMCMNGSRAYVLCMQMWTLQFGTERSRELQERGYLCVCDREYSVSVACDTQCSLCDSQATVSGTCARGQNSLCVSCLLLNRDWQRGFFVRMNVSVCVTSLFLFLCVCASIWQTDRDTLTRCMKGDGKKLPSSHREKRKQQPTTVKLSLI